MKANHIKFQNWIDQMNYVLDFHKFKIEATPITAKNGKPKTSISVYGEDMNGYMLIPPTFPSDFIQHLSTLLKSKMKGDTIRYKIKYGQLQPLFQQYLAKLNRQEKINNIIND